MHEENLTSLLDISGLHVLRVNQSDVLRERSRIKTRNSFRPYGFHGKMIRVLTPIIVGPVSEIFSKSLETGYYLMKCANISPIFKGDGSQLQPSYHLNRLTGVTIEVFKRLAKMLSYPP